MTVDENVTNAWLSIGGFVAGADGLSDEELDELSATAAGPDGDADSIANAIKAAASADTAPAEAIETVGQTDIMERVSSLLDVYRAAAVDGMSGTEWARFCHTAGQIVGDDKVDSLVRLCQLDTEINRIRQQELLS